MKLIFTDIAEYSLKLNKTDILMGIDYGEKKIGLAITSPSRTMALPLAILSHNRKIIFEEINKLITNNNVGGLVVGIPVNMDGSHGESAKKTEHFALKLSKYSTLPIFLQDERRTSKAADSLLMLAGYKRIQRNNMDDSIAATLILESAVRALESFSKTTL